VLFAVVHESARVAASMSLSGGGTGGSRIIMADLITGRLDFSLATFNSARSNMDAKKGAAT
jgi:hypothetical protein